MSRVILTGASGFIGSHLCEALAAKGHQVWGLDNMQGGRNTPAGFALSAEPPADGVNALTINDLADEGSDLVQHFAAFKPDVLVHCAANAREGASQFQPEHVTRSDVWAYARTVRAAIASGSLKRVVYFSSMARYGLGEHPPPFAEHFRPQPEDVYAANKVCGEVLTRALAEVHDFSFSIIVPHNVFGGRQAFDRYRNVVTIFANQIMRGEPVTIYGDGNQRRAFSYVDDSLPCFIRAVDGTADGCIVNVGGKVHVTLNELAAAVKEDMGVAAGYPTTHSGSLRPLEVRDAWCTTALSEQLLGYVENVGWREGVRRTCAWAKALGPQEWMFEPLELGGKKLPEAWRR